MHVSIVTGTFNRLESLKRMVSSVRDQMPRGLLFEIVVVDGGSTDGTLDWCKGQFNIKLIEHGALYGAIKAFGDGARAAEGEYVVMANDDITFRPLSILAAVAHLEVNRDCGAVAFADNRTSLVTGNGTEYRVEGMGATIMATGQKTMVPYAQVGMFRKWLGDFVGWWGDTDPVMSRARTYGGDNFLSAMIWELGYSVDPVPMCQVEDHIVRDDLRGHNNRTGSADSAAFYARFPTVRISVKRGNSPEPERMRILHLPVYEVGHPGRENREAGLTEALSDYGMAIEWDYLNDKVDLVNLVKAWQPDLLITQIQGVGKDFTAETLLAMRNTAPDMVVVNWNGDAHEQGLVSNGVLGILKHVDLQTVVNAKVLPIYQQLSIPAAYWQIGYKDPAVQPPQVRQYEVLWQGNCYNSQRDMLVRALRSIKLENLRPVKLGMFGNCRGSDGNSHYDFALQYSLYSTAIVTVGDTFPDTYGFVSNRLFQALSAGAFMLQQVSPGLDNLTGLKAGIHYIEWHSLGEMVELIIFWLSPKMDEERRAIAQAGKQFVRDNFSFAAQARKLFSDLLPAVAGVHHERV